MYTTPKTVLASISFVLVAMAAGTADAVPERAAAATLPADPQFAAMIQCNVGDVANVSLWIAWVAVAMLLALCWSEWVHSQQASRSHHVPRR